MSARVLLIGPADEHLKELKVVLQQAGFQIETADDGLEALEIVYQFRPHLIITELMLKGMSGFNLSSRLSESEVGLGSKVIFYTQSYRDERSRQAAILEHHALHYFVKPFQKDVLLKTVIALLDRIGPLTETALPKEMLAPPSLPREKRISPSPTGCLSSSASPVPPRHLAIKTPTRVYPFPFPNLSKGAGNGLSAPPARSENVKASRLQLKPPPAATSVVVQESDSAQLRGASTPHSTLLQTKFQSEVSARKELNEPTAMRGSASRDSLPLRRSFSRKTSIFAGAAATLVVLGLSLALGFRSDHLLETKTLGLPALSEDKIVEATRAGSGTNAAAVVPKRPASRGVVVGAATTRRLKDSALNQLDVSPDSASPNDQGQQTDRERAAMGLPSSGSIELIISDIFPSEGQPVPTTMVHPSLSKTEMRAMGPKPFLVSLELDESGSVKSARLVKTHAEGTFPVKILNAVRQWRFFPKETTQSESWLDYFRRHKRQQGAWVKYFSFRVPSLNE